LILQNQDSEAFEEWVSNLPNNEMYLQHKEMMKLAWLQAIKYEQNKPIKTYRWNGVL
jgi:hypothetical protein